MKLNMRIYASALLLSACMMGYVEMASAQVYTSFAQAMADATSTSAACNMTFSNITVLATSSSNAYLQDANGDAAIIYNSGHGLSRGQQISATLDCNFQLYNGMLEFTGSNLILDSFTVNATGVEVAPLETTLADLANTDNHASFLGKLVKVTNVQVTDEVYARGTTSLTDGTNSVILYNTFYYPVASTTTFDTTAYYDVTGIVPAYRITEISPRDEADVVLHGAQALTGIAAEQAQEGIAYGVNGVRKEAAKGLVIMNGQMLFNK